MVTEAPIQNGGADQPMSQNSDIDSLKLDLPNDQQLTFNPDYHNEYSEDDEEEDENEDNNGIVNFGYDTTLAVNQNCPGAKDNNAPNVFVSDSTGIHVGTKNIYQGPVTIKKIVYAGVNNNSDGDDVVLAQNGGLHPNGALANGKCDKHVEAADFDLKTCVVSGAKRNGSEKTDKTEHNSNNKTLGRSFKEHFRKLKYNTSLLIILMVSAIAIIMMITLFFLLLRSSESPKFPGDSDEQQGRPSIPSELPPYNLVDRTGWVAQPPAKLAPTLHQPTPLVIIHQSDTTNCTQMGDCIFSVRYLQMYHIESKKMWDISYNFLVGGDGNVYEGRGWHSEGAHTLKFNSRSIGIALIGTFDNYLPGEDQLDVLFTLIQYGVDQGYLKEDYTLIGARQVLPVRNPGEALFEELKTWPHWADINQPSHPPADKVRIISRREWLARPPQTQLGSLPTPVPYVVIMHSATENCNSQSSCTRVVRSIQDFHVFAQNWDDIGYSWLVGGDGYVYEGRGWETEGAHTRFYNRMSIGIAFIGTFTDNVPPQSQMNAAKNLIALGVNESYIQEDYKLFGARQFSSTESPGQMLYEDLVTWPHWTAKPGKPKA